MLRTLHWPTALRVGVASLLLATAAHAADIEGLFQEQHDFSGTYKIATGLSPDSATRYTGTVTILKPTEVRTPRGTIVKFYRIRYEIDGDEPMPGVAVEAGGTLFTAYGRSQKYGLMFLAKFDMPSEAFRAVEDRDRLIAKNKGYTTSVTFKGKLEPWWWEFNKNTNAYGYWFHVDGTFGYVKGDGVSFPPGDTRWEAVVRQVLPNGDIRPRTMDRRNAYREGFYMRTPDYGQIITLYCGNAYGAGMRLTPELLFGSWGGSNDGGVSMYEVKGRQLVGRYVGTNGDRTGVEILDVPDDVAAKNALFQ